MIYPFILPGYDPTPNPSTPSNSLLYQMVNEAAPASTIGFVIWSQTAPDAVTYPDLRRCLWGKLSGSNVPTGAFFWYDGANWQPLKLEDGSLTGAAFADKSISVAKLTPGGSLQILRTAANPLDGVEWVDVGNLFTANSINLSTLVNAPAAGYVMYSDTGGVWNRYLFSDVWFATLAGANLPIAQVRDVDGEYADGQVASISSTGDYLVPAWADQLLRENTVTTSKLIWGGVANAGKTPRVNSLGTDVEFVSPSDPVVLGCAVLAYQVAAGAYGQGVPINTLTQIQWNGAQDPQSIIILTSNRFTFTATGVYLVDFSCPVINAGVGDTQGHVIFYNVTDAVAITADVFRAMGPTGTDRPRIVYQLTVNSTATIYEFQVWDTSSNLWLMPDILPLNHIYPNRYQHVVITKIS